MKVNFQREFSGGVLVLRSSSLLLEAQRRLVALSLSSKTFLLFSVPFSFRERSKLNKCFFFLFGSLLVGTPVILWNFLSDTMYKLQGQEFYVIEI